MKQHCRVAIAATVLIATACQKDQTDELRGKLKAPEVATRVAAASDLGKQRTASRPAIPELLAALRDEAWQVRVAASVALVRIGDKESPARAIEPLVVLTRDGNAWVRRYAAWALGAMGGGHAALVTALSDDAPLVRTFATEAVTAIADEVLKATAGKPDAKKLAVAEATVKKLADARPALEAIANDASRLRHGKYDATPVVKEALAAITKAAEATEKAAAKLKEAR